jgi:hypothetical protein
MNTEVLYYSVVEFMEEFAGKNPYIAFIDYVGLKAEKHQMMWIT